MAWIESHQSLGSHIKLKRLARELNIHRAQAIGHLHLLWWWALDNAPSGNLSALSTVEIAEVSEWPGNVDRFAAALKACGWIDVDGCIHDWWEYAGKLVDQRAKDKERKRKAREAEKNAMSAGCPPDVLRTGVGNPQDGGQTAVVPNPTQPNRTEQNQPNTPAQRGGASARPANVGEVIGVGAICGVGEQDCRDWYRDMDQCGWAKVDGTPFGNWKRELTIHRDRIRERQARQSGAARSIAGERKEIQETIQIRKAVINGSH